MKLIRIETIPENTGLRALTLWNEKGEVTFGELPSGIAPSLTEIGGIYIRRIRERITMTIRGAITTSGTPQILIPNGFRVGGAPYPIVGITLPRSPYAASARIGSSTIYISGIPTGFDLSGPSLSYGVTIPWETTSPMPHPDTYPGLPA
ncbi:hypothetical protein NYP18_09245 [Corynebacterium sp. YIM 101645]|uniref:Uncharacterized protein n=1 Tax=Corynebacterium lemuris TaxID=1859292 RepID=A0ABT2FXU7_9CORY|nr:hypothetical protein [Corynebacterium lemuris]MCS5479844.1 hypothetical protein [Corynebacterium lemuris]